MNNKDDITKTPSPTSEGVNPDWLVKSSGRILGPYNISQIEEGLAERKFSVLDEVRSKDKRWKFVKETPELSSIVETLSKSKTGQTQSQITLSKTAVDLSNPAIARNTVTTDVDFDNTPTPFSDHTVVSNPNAQLKPNTNVMPDKNQPLIKISPEDVLFRNSNIVTSEEAKNQAKAEKEASRNASAEKNKSKEKKTPVTRVFFVWLLGVILLSVIGFFVFNEFIKNQRNQVDSQKRIRRASELYISQLYAAAYTEIQPLVDLRLNNGGNFGVLTSEDKLIWAELLLTVAGRANEALPLLDEVLSDKSLSASSQSRARYWVAFAAVKDNNLPSAREKLMPLVSAQPEANYLLALMDVLEKKYESAVGRADQLLSVFVEEASYLKMYAIYRMITGTEMDIATKDKWIRDSIAYLELLLEKPIYMRSEFNLLLVYFTIQKELPVVDNNMIYPLIERILQEDPEHSESLLKNNLLDHQLETGTPLEVCRNIFDRAKGDPVFNALESYCLWKWSNKNEALQTLAVQIKKYPDEKYLMALSVYFSDAMNLKESAASLVSYPGVSQLSLVKKIKGDILLDEKKYPEAEQAYQEVLAQNAGYYSAYVGLMNVYKATQRSDLLQSTLDRALSAGPLYLPFIMERLGSNEKK